MKNLLLKCVLFVSVISSGRYVQSQNLIDVASQEVSQNGFTVTYTVGELFQNMVCDEHFLCKEGLLQLAQSSPLFLQTSLTEKIEFYPNPFQSTLNVSLPSKMSSAQCSLFDMKGNLIYSTDLKSGVNALNLSQFEDQMYLLKIDCGKNQFQFKVIKNH